jgi:HPr kinase/phosphorylase
VGLVDISSLFGIQAVRRQKRIEVVVELCDWESAKDIDRTGLDDRTTEILGVELTHVMVPLNPGKNITVISEVVALNYLLRWNGVDPAQRLNEKLIQRMAEKRELKEYLSEDYE